LGARLRLKKDRQKEFSTIASDILHLLNLPNHLPQVAQRVLNCVLLQAYYYTSEGDLNRATNLFMIGYSLYLSSAVVMSNSSIQWLHCFLVCAEPNETTRTFWWQLAETKTHKNEQDMDQNLLLCIVYLLENIVTLAPQQAPKTKQSEDINRKILVLLKQCHDKTEEDWQRSRISAESYNQAMFVISGCKSKTCHNLEMMQEAEADVNNVIQMCGRFEVASCNLCIPIALFFVLSVCKELNFQYLFNRGITWLETFLSIYPIVQRFTKRLVSSPNVYYHRQTVSANFLLMRSSTGEIIETLLPPGSSGPPAEPLPVPTFNPVPPSLDPLAPDGYINSSLKPVPLDERLDASKPVMIFPHDSKPSLMVDIDKNPTSEEKPETMSDQSGFQQNYVPYTTLEPHGDAFNSFDGTLDELLGLEDLGFLTDQIY